MSYVHNIIHCVMAIFILAVGNLYIQLRDQFDDVVDSCKIIQSGSVQNRDINHLLISRTIITHQYIQSSHAEPATELLALGTVKNDASHYETKGYEKIIAPHSIFQSQFESRQIALETTEKLVLNNPKKNIEAELVELSQYDDKSTTDIVSTPTLNQVMITSQTSLNTFFQSSQTSVIEQSDATVNHLVLQSSIQTSLAEISLQKDEAYGSKYSEDEKTSESATTAPDVVLINTKFISSPQAVEETRKVMLGSSSILSPVTHITDDLATSVSNLGGEEFKLVASTQMAVKQENLFCVKNDCLRHSATSDSLLYEDDERTIDFTFDQNNLLNGDVHASTKLEEQKAVQYLNFDQTADARTIDLLISQGTSANCEENVSQGKMCRFHNLCFKKKEKDFIFAQGSTSLIESSTAVNYTDIFTLNLSTVPDHNAHFMSLVSLPAESLRQFSVAIVDKTTFIMSRFKPDNIMHVLHDDILPLLDTLNGRHLQHLNKKPDLALLFTDSFHYGDFIHLYSSLSSIHPILLHKLNTSVDIICFADTYIGLSASTLWYQYGFFKPQGPLLVNSTNVQKVQRAAKYLADHFKKDCVLCKNKNHLVLISRKDNRLILNEGELIMSIARSTKLKIMSVSLEMQSLDEIISIVRSSKGIIGMHGSLLSLLIFLPPGSVVIELFPFGINPSKYSPFQTFCQLPGSGLVYKPWVNPYKHKSVGHPDWAAELGGIHHLPDHVQVKILQESDVQDHLCCSDPSWLYHIYQDTEVDVDAVTTLTVASLAHAKATMSNTKPSKPTLQYYPGPVKNMSCSYISSNDLSGYQITWSLPWNLEFIPYKFLESQLVYQEKTANETTQVNLEFSVMYFVIKTTEDNSGSAYNVWVRVVADHLISGPYSYIACNR